MGSNLALTTELKLFLLSRLYFSSLAALISSQLMSLLPVEIFNHAMYICILVSLALKSTYYRNGTQWKTLISKGFMIAFYIYIYIFFQCISLAVIYLSDQKEMSPSQSTRSHHEKKSFLFSLKLFVN